MEELFNPHSNEWLLNKFEYYKKLRDLDCAYHSEKYGLYVITRYQDVIDALSNHMSFSSSQGNLIIEHSTRFNMTLGASDNPIHDLYKNVVRNAYTKNNIERIGNFYKEKVREQLAGKSQVNLSDVVDHTTAWATAEILNLPYDKETIKNLIVGIQRHSNVCVQNNVDQTTSRNLNKIILKCLFNQVPSTGPGIYHEFINNNPKKIRTLSLFTGPTISGASSLTGAVQFLLLDLYRQGIVESLLADKTLIPDAINEALRFNSTTGRFSRTVTQPVTLHGIDLKPGDRVALCLESANRDERKFENPDIFDITRKPGQLAFGHGLHACIALAISKSLMQIFLEELLDVFGNYRVITKNEELSYVMTASGNDDMVSNIIIEKI